MIKMFTIQPSVGNLCVILLAFNLSLKVSYISCDKPLPYCMYCYVLLKYSVQMFKVLNMILLYNILYNNNLSNNERVMPIF